MEMIIRVTSGIQEKLRSSLELQRRVRQKGTEIERQTSREREIGRQTDTESSRHTEREAEIVLDLLSLAQATV